MQTIGPETLIKYSEVKIRLVIQKNPFMPLCIFLHGNFAHAEIRLHLVITHFDVQVVEVRIGRRPESCFFNRDIDELIRITCCGFTIKGNSNRFICSSTYFYGYR
ncbi:hypothetical protein D3C87_1758980 [compost metagenome]